MAEDARSQRRAAKGRFTRKLNELRKSVDDDKGVEIVKGNYDELTEAWRSVESKHDAYTILLEDSEVEANEEWILELQRSFSEAMEQYIRYANTKAAKEKTAKQEVDRKEQAKLDLSKTRRMMDQAFIKRNTTEAVFKTLVDEAIHLLDSHEAGRDAIPALRKVQQALETSLADCKAANDKYFEFLDRDEALIEVGWILFVQKQYNKVSDRIESHIAKVSPKSYDQSTEAKLSNLRLEKIKMPRFDGDLRGYPRFKKDFEVQVMPSLTNSTAPYTLRSCLGKEPMNVVKGVDDDITEMWRRLDDKYGDPAKLADAIIDSVQRVKPIKEGEDKRFIEFIEIVEGGYRDLLRIGLEREITTTSSVSIIEKRLPPNIRKDWAKLVSSDTSPVDKRDKFPSLLKFLLHQKRAIEYDSADLRKSARQAINHASVVVREIDESNHSDESRTADSRCIFHGNARHETSECRLYLAKTCEERMTMLKEKGACWSCLKIGHRIRDCRRKKICGENGCTRTHHKTIHSEATPINVSATASACSSPLRGTCLLQVQKIKTKKGWANVMWDNGASLSFITNNKAKDENLRGNKVELSIVKVGGKVEKIVSQKYLLDLIDSQGKVVQFEVYGIDRITTDIESVNTDDVIHMFENIVSDEIRRPAGNVDVLIGYRYAGYHPEPEQRSGHLLLLKNRFGRCLGGNHATLEQADADNLLQNAQVHHLSGVKVEDFFSIENLGVECTPRCRGCKCGKCPLGAKDYSLNEEKELHLIENNLEFDETEGQWIAAYPWIKDPSDLPNNRRATQGMFASTKKRLARNPSHAKVYQEQIQDMVDRGVARKLTREEMETYQGSIHYVAHHEVLRPDSKSTPVRIIFNSGAKYMGHMLNEYWAKGPDLLNSLLGIPIRLRENEVAFMGDIKKMYHSVKTPPVEQHTHRFLWRDMNVCEEPDTYVIQRVSCGDEPSATIATVTLRETAQMEKEVRPEAAKIILENTCMGGIVDSVRDKRKARSATPDIEKLIDKGRFEVKGWIFSGEHDSKDEMLVPNDKNAAAEKVLGVAWNPVEDKFCFKVKLNFSERKKKLRTESDIDVHQLQEKIPQVLTKRMILSQVNGTCDPLGLAGPFYCSGKNGEIQSGTNVEEGYWTATQKNIADWLTRGKRPEEIDRNSPWQNDPDLLRFSEAEWPISSECNVQELPQQVSVVMMTLGRQSQDNCREREQISLRTGKLRGWECFVHERTCAILCPCVLRYA